MTLSRFALLASGPWEWDETIFARGMLHFELAAHFPHPPGFPGLLTLGHLLWPLAGTPYRALQILSALCSVLAVWPLATLGRKVAPRPVATLAALFVLSLPGPWLFSVRGFSTIPATFFLLWAAALLGSGLHGRRATIFTILLTVAFLVRPILLPSVGLLWLYGAYQVKPLRRLLLGMIVSSAAIVAAVAVMVHLEGGWHAFVAPFVRHASFHAYRLDWNTHMVADYGLIKGVGGTKAAAILAVVSCAGLLRWWRTVGWRSATAWTVALGLCGSQLIMLQNRSYARYATVVHISAAPLIAGAAALSPMPVAAAGLLLATGMAGRRSLPLLNEQHDETFGAWQVTLDAASLAAQREWAIIVEPEVYPFASYWWHVLEHRGEDPPPLILSPRAPEPWHGVDRPWVLATVHPELYLPSLANRQKRFGAVSEALRPLTQGRFLEAELSENPPLPIGRWWARETTPEGREFMWAGPSAQLWLPPLSRPGVIGIHLAVRPGDEPLELSLPSATQPTVTLSGYVGETWVWFKHLESHPSEPLVVSFSRARGYPPNDEDERALSCQLFDVVVRPAGAAFAGPLAGHQERDRLRVSLNGAHTPERFAGGRTGVWLRPESELRIHLTEPGRLELLLSAPRPTPSRTRLRAGAGAWSTAHDLSPEAEIVEIPIAADAIQDGVATIGLQSAPFNPAELDGGSDHRELGVVLHELRFVPEEPAPPGWWE